MGTARTIPIVLVWGGEDEGWLFAWYTERWGGKYLGTGRM